ncbi:unnamed protein product, partial [Durusdinium trenchii]
GADHDSVADLRGRLKPRFCALQTSLEELHAEVQGTRDLLGELDPGEAGMNGKSPSGAAAICPGERWLDQ